MTMKSPAILKALTALVLILIALFLYKGVPMFNEIRSGTKPNYEVGKHMGAEKCGQCHPQIYRQWSRNSAHAKATETRPFLDFKDKFTGNFMFNAMMGEAMCYACHGSKEVSEGVNCETCHGLAAPDEPIMQTHEKKYKPGLDRMRSGQFCSGCHNLTSPFSGDALLSVYSEWLESEAAQKGLTCQKCHMRPRGGDFAYHGFDSVSRNIGIYNGEDLALKDIVLDFPQISLKVQNLVTGHAIPAVGPSRILVLEISLFGFDGKEAHSITETFGKYYNLMPVFGIMPNSEIRNTQLQSGEVRNLSYTLPSELMDKIDKAELTFRFYDVSDDHQGDITRAHHVSEPFIIKQITF